jgi:glutamate dehydrogenase (NAD(P)+)
MTVSDDKLGDIGYLVVDRTVQGSASGGVRFAPDVSIPELTSLSRSMTYKWAFLNIPMGGAKAGIFAVPDQVHCQRSELMEAFGRGISSIVHERVYFPGIDMGTTLEDLYSIMQGAGKPLDGEQIDGSYATALTVFETIRQVSYFCGKGLDSVRVALEGFGKVASVVGKMLHDAGATLVGISTIEGAITSNEGFDPQGLLQLKELFGDCLVHHAGTEVMPPEDLYSLDVDLLIPGARPWVITEDNADEIKASWIVPISNAPSTPESEKQLSERGVLFVPDFIANCGGILSSAMRSNHFSLDDVQHLVTTIYAHLIFNMLQESSRRGLRFGEFAREIAWQNHLNLKKSESIFARSTDKAAELIKTQDWVGVKQRIAYRAHRKRPQWNGAIRSSALARYADLTLGGAIDQLKTMGKGA